MDGDVGRCVVVQSRWVGPVVLALGSAVAGGPVAGPVEAGAQAPGLGPCHLEVWAGPAWCGAVAVAEDPASPSGRRLSLNVVVLGATGPDSVRVPDPVFVLDVPGGGSDTLRLTRTRFGSVLRMLMLSPAGGAQVPFLVP